MSDIHGNLPALEMVIASEKVDGYLVLGDVVNYAPWSNECVDMLSSLSNCVCLMGNHEEYFINGEFSGKNDLVTSFFNQCIKDFDRFEIISNYKKDYLFYDYSCVHTIENKYIFHDTEVNLDKNYLIGHSHQQYQRVTNNYSLINPGSVGQNRKYINIINYMIYDSDKNSFEQNQLKYDIGLVLDKMKNENYPQECINYYKDKKIYN